MGTQWGQRVVTVSGHTWSRRGRCGDKLRTEWGQSGDRVAQSGDNESQWADAMGQSGDSVGTEYGQRADRKEQRLVTVARHYGDNQDTT